MSARPRENEKQKDDKIAEVEPVRSADDLKARDKGKSDYWEKIDNLFYSTISHAELSFKINVSLNVLVAAVGLAILSYSMFYSWINGLDLYATAFGTLGVASFVTLFYFSPQKKIQKTTGNLAQMQMLYRTYCMQAEEVNDLCYRHNPKTIEELEKINKHLAEETYEICQRIEEFIEKD